MADDHSQDADHLVTSDDPLHPANHIPSLCAHFYTLGWVTGTGGGTSIRKDDKVYLAPTGVQKELIKPQDIFVLPADCIEYNLAKKDRWAVLATLLIERDTPGKGFFEIEKLEQIKGIPKGPGKQGNLGYLDRLKVPIIPNTPKEEDLTESLEKAILQWPDTYAVLVERHGTYVWGDTVAQAKTICESLDYIFQLAVNMTAHRIPLVATETQRA